MNKRFLIFVVLLATLCSCGNSSKTANKNNAKKHIEVKQDAVISQALTVSDFLKIADKNVDKQILVSGKVKHVCEHSGRRCFIVDNEGNSLKIEASGELKGFNKELAGMNIEVIGFVNEKRLTKEQIDKISESQKVEAEDGHCGTESANILKMRDWMKKNGKDYYAFYYINGISYTSK